MAIEQDWTLKAEGWVPNEAPFIVSDEVPLAGLTAREARAFGLALLAAADRLGLDPPRRRPAMTTTTTISTWATLTGGRMGATPDDMIADALGGYVGEYNLTGLVDDYRRAVRAVLPEGVSLAGDELVAVVGASCDLAAIREAVDGIDLYALAERQRLA